MTINGYFNVVFGSSGDLTAVPDAVQLDGTVSYTQGYGGGYELPVGNPARVVINRAQDNQLWNDVTSAMQQLQKNSAPPFITSAMNGGSSFSYSKNMRVILGGVIYQSLTDSNTSTPPGASWTSVLPVVTTGSSMLKGNGSGGISNATAGTDYSSGTAALSTGILKSTVTTGALSIATAGTDYLAPSGSGAALTGITASQISGLPLTSAFASSPQTLTVAGSVTVSHGLGAVPLIVEMELVCNTTSNGFTAGQVLAYNTAADISSASTGWSVIKTSSSIIIRYGNTGFEYSDPTNGTAIALTTTNFTLIIRAFK